MDALGRVALCFAVLAAWRLWEVAGWESVFAAAAISFGVVGFWFVFDSVVDDWRRRRDAS